MIGPAALVTGGAGLVGRAVVRALPAAGWKAAALGRSPRPADLDQTWPYIQADLLTGKTIPGEWRLVVHAAADLSGGPGALADNLNSTRTALETALDAGARFIYISSLPVIGRPLTAPLTEDHPVRPATEYHLSKYGGELLARLPRYAGLRPVILRLPSPLGPGRAAGRLVPTLLAACRRGQPLRLLGRGGRVQNYLDVADAARAVLLAAENPAAEGVFLIGGHSRSNLDLARLCREISGSESEIIFEGTDPEEDLRWVVDGRRAAEVLGYHPIIPLAETLGRLLETAA